MFSKQYLLSKKYSIRRHLAIATWKAPESPLVYMHGKVDYTYIRKFLDEFNQSSTVKINILHVVIKAVALTLQRFPELNVIIRRRKIYIRKSVDIYVPVAIKGKDNGEYIDLSGVLISNCDVKSLREIALEIAQKSESIRSGKDPLFERSKKIIKSIPSFILPWFLRFISYIMYDLGYYNEKLGLPENAFGSVMISNIGSFKVPSAYMTLVPYMRCPLAACLGEVRNQPWVLDDDVVVRPILDLRVTYDHRVADGFEVARMAKYLRTIMEHPEKSLTSERLKNEQV